jgi:hypothetical protein
MTDTRLSRRARVIATACLALLVAALWSRKAAPVPIIRAAAARWDLQLASAGDKPIPALVYGRKTGFHLVTVEPRALGADRSTSIAGALNEGDVWMVSLGWSALDVRSSAPVGQRPMSFSASGRIIKAYQHPSGTGVLVW